MRNFSIKNTIWKNKGHELDKLSECMLDKEKQYYLVGGISSDVRNFITRNMNTIPIEGYIVSEDQQPDVLGISNVCAEDSTLRRKLSNGTAVIICVARERNLYNRIVEFWCQQGCIINENLFQGEVFEAIYYTYKFNQIRLDRVEIFLTNCCSLNCEKCIAYIPYFKKKEHTPLEQLKEDANVLLQKVDFIDKVKLLGGEGFLYPYLIEYVDYLHENYKNKIGSIRIGTNGTIFPSDAVIDMCKRNKVIVDISDYTNAVPNKCKLQEVNSYLKKYGVETDIKRTGEQWLDMGFPDNIPTRRTEPEELNHFNQCAMFCRHFSNKKLYFCCSNFSAVRAGLFPDNENDYFDFTQDFTKKELLEFELGYSKLGYTTFCRVCNGCSDEANERKVEVAKQVKREGYNENI